MPDEGEVAAPAQGDDAGVPREDTWGERGADWLPGRQLFDLPPVVVDRPASPGGLVGTDPTDSSASSAAPEGGDN
jgi:hypothetical protein